MRAFSTISLTCGLALVAVEANAQYADHRLIAYANSSFGPAGSAKDVGLPETSALAQYDVADEPGALLITNRAHIDSDTGAMTLTMALRDVAGDISQPVNEWNLYVGFEEKITASTPNKTSLKVNLPRPLALAAIIDTPSTGVLTVRAVLETQSSTGTTCRGEWVQQHAGPNRQPQPPAGSGNTLCGSAPAGWTAVVDEATGITIDMPDMGRSVSMMGYYQIDLEDLTDIRELDAEVKGTLTMVSTGGGVTGKSPTFLTKGTTAPPGDAGGPNPGTPNGSPDGGATDPNVAPNEPALPPAEDDSCNASGTKGATSASRGVGSLALVALAAVATRRLRRRA